MYLAITEKDFGHFRFMCRECGKERTGEFVNLKDFPDYTPLDENEAKKRWRRR